MSKSFECVHLRLYSIKENIEGDAFCITLRGIGLSPSDAIKPKFSLSALEPPKRLKAAPGP